MADTKPNNSIKRSLIGRSNSQIVIVTAVASFLVVFSLVASVALVKQLSYQNRVISAKKQALNQLKSDITATDSLVSSYKNFASSPTNLLGGSSTGTGPQDGSNAKLVLDALPSQYDFPALATSLEKLLTSQKVSITSINGTDDELAQSATQSSSNPQPVPMPFQVSVIGDYNSSQNVINVFEHSIRPIQVQTLQITSSSQSLSMDISAQTFYQPEKALNIGSKVVK